MDFNCRKAAELGRGDSLLFTTKSPGDPDTDFTDLGRMKSWVYPKTLSSSNPGFMDNYERKIIVTLSPKVGVLKFDQV